MTEGKIKYICNLNKKYYDILIFLEDWINSDDINLK